MTVDNNRTVWINVTTSSHWNRAVVGVVRVETELSVGLGRLYSEGKFKRCVWREGVFVEYMPPPIDKPQETAVVAEPMPREPLPAPSFLFPILSRRDAAKSIAQGVLSLAPERLRPIFNRALHFLKGKLARLVHSKGYRQFKQRSAGLGPGLVRTDVIERFSKGRESIFNPGDVLLSVGLDWDYPYADEFMRLRAHESVKVVRCCYDLIPVLYPQYCVADVAAHFTRYFLDVADSSDRVLCISKQSESDLQDLLNRTGGRAVNTDVFTLGDNIVEALDDSIGSSVRAIAAEPYILYVSTIERRKNHQVLYQAYHQLCRQGKQHQLPKLVFVGMRGWGVDELFKDIELDPATKGSIIHCNHVNDAELRHLYQEAVCCVFPSLYEGWGLPVAEALAMGKIVLSSDRGSLKEVGGELVTYIDPWHSGDWAKEIWRVVTDHAYRKGLADKVEAFYKPRHWHETAVAVKLIIDELLVPVVTPQTFYCGYELTAGVGQHVGPVICSRAKSGLLFSGPHKALVAGRYTVEIWDLQTQRKPGCCSVRVLADDLELAILENIEFSATQSALPLLSVDIELLSAAVDFDVRCELQSGELSVERIVLVSL